MQRFQWAKKNAAISSVPLGKSGINNSEKRDQHLMWWQFLFASQGNVSGGHRGVSMATEGRRMALLGQCCLLGRTPGTELWYDLIRTKLLTDTDSIYQPQALKISGKQKKTQKTRISGKWGKKVNRRGFSDVFKIKKKKITVKCISTHLSVMSGERRYISRFCQECFYSVCLNISLYLFF